MISNWRSLLLSIPRCSFNALPPTLPELGRLIVMRGGAVWSGVVVIRSAIVLLANAKFVLALFLFV